MTIKLLKTSIIITFFLASFQSYAGGTKVFEAKFNESTTIERLYEAVDVTLTITDATDAKFLEKATIRGVASIDAVNGRMMIELNQLVQAGMPTEIVGFVIDQNEDKGVAACSEWQTRMFEDSKLCYSAEVGSEQAVKVVISMDGFESAVVQANNAPVEEDNGFLDGPAVEEIAGATVETSTDAAPEIIEAEAASQP